MKNEKLKINITAGEFLNKFLSNEFEGLFIPFNEALSKGDLYYPLFDENFIHERCKVLGVTNEEYKMKLKDFLSFLDSIDKYDEIILWFGNDLFCQVNLLGVLTLLEQYHFCGKITLNIVDEENNNEIIQKMDNVKLGSFTKEYQKRMMGE